jgi:type I restriction enzyme S subunit
MRWPKQKIGCLFDVQLGKMLSEKARTGNQYPYLANFNVRWGSFDLSCLNQMAFSEKEREKFVIKKGDLLMCEGGEIGRCAVWGDDQCSFFYQKALHRLRPLDDRMNPYFLYYFILHISTKGNLLKLAGETSFAHLTQEKLIDLMVPVPPRHLQDQICELLMSWDTAFEKTGKLMEAKEKRFSGLLNRFLNQGSMKDEWRRGKLRDVVEINKGQQLNVADMLDTGKYYALNGGIEPSGFTNNWNTPKNTITISEGGNSCGFVNFNTEKFWCGGHCYALNNLSSEVSHKYLYHFLKACERSLMSMRVGSGLPNIQKKDLQDFPVTFPSLSEQKQIVAVLDTGRQEIDILKKHAEAYRKQKRGLMQKLLTGHWRVAAREEVDSIDDMDEMDKTMDERAMKNG